MIIMGAAEFAAVFIPAMIAFGAGAYVMLQGLTDIYTKISSGYTVTEALGTAFHTTGGQIYGLGNAIQTAQDAMQPQIYELLGAAINGVKAASGGAAGQMNLFATQGKQVVGVLDEFGARLDVDLKTSMGQINGLLAMGVQDLTEFGQILGNVGHALLNFASAMPGIAEVLLRIIDGISGFILWLSKLPPMLITVVMGIEEAYRWSGALASIMGVLGKAIALVGTLGIPVFTKIGQNIGSMAASVIMGVEGMVGNFGKLLSSVKLIGTDGEQAIAGFRNTLQDAANFMTGPWGAAIGLGAAALGALVIWMVNTKDATQQWVGSLMSAVNQLTGLNQIGATFNALTQVTAAYGQSTRQLSQDLQQGSGQTAEFSARFGEYSGAVQRAASDNQALGMAQQQLGQDFNNEIANVQLISQKFGVDYVQAAELAGEAGANLTVSMKGNSEAGKIQMQMIDNLVKGYGGMANETGVLGQGITAVTVAAGLQNSKVQQLTQAWSTVMSTIQGPSNGFIAISQSLDQFNSDAQTAGATMTGLGGAATKTTRNVTDASTKLQGDFNNTVSAMQGYTNSLMTAASVTGDGGPLVQGIKDEIAILLPMAGSNANAAAQIKVLWQEAGGSSSDSLKQIGTAVSGISNPLQNLQTLTGKVSLSMANLGQDAQNLAQTISSSLNQAITQEAQSLAGVTPAIATYMTDLQKYGAVAPQTAAAQDKMNQAVSNSTALAAAATSGVNALTGKTQAQGNAAQATAAQQKQLNTAIQDMESKSGATTPLINALTTAITNSGAHSQTAAGLAAQLRQALINAGEGAQTASGQVNALVNAISNLHSKQITITTTLVTQSISQAGKIPVGVAAATGGRIPGYGGGDIVPALLEPGEAVVPKHLTAAVAPFLKSQGVPGFASGSTNVANRAAAASQDAAMLAKFFPVPPIPAPAALPPQFMGEWLPSSMIGVPAPPVPVTAGGGTPTGSGGATGSTPPGRQRWHHDRDEDRDLHSHITINMDGRKIWEGEQKHTLRYNLRNNGVPTGLQKPR